MKNYNADIKGEGMKDNWNIMFFYNSRTLLIKTKHLGIKTVYEAQRLQAKDCTSK